MYGNLCFEQKCFFFYLKIFILTALKNRCILHGHVFVMHNHEPATDHSKEVILV